MKRATRPIPVVTRNVTDEQTLPLIVADDAQVKQLIRRLEAERKETVRTQSVSRSSSQREPYAYD